MPLLRRKWAYRVAPMRPDYEGMILATEGLLAYYRYEMLPGGFPQDSSPSGYHVTFVSGGTDPVQVDGQIGFGLGVTTKELRASFPVPATDAPRFQGDQASIECWFRWGGVGGGAINARQDNTVNGQWPHRVIIDPDGSFFDINCSINGTAGFATTVDSIDTIPQDELWHHMVYTYDEDVITRLYVDNVVMDEAVVTLDAACTFGGDERITWEYGDTWIDEFAFYSRALTAGEVAQHYTVGRLY